MCKPSNWVPTPGGFTRGDLGFLRPRHQAAVVACGRAQTLWHEIRVAVVMDQAEWVDWERVLCPCVSVRASVGIVGPWLERCLGRIGTGIRPPHSSSILQMWCQVQLSHTRWSCTCLALPHHHHHHHYQQHHHHTSAHLFVHLLCLHLGIHLSSLSPSTEERRRVIHLDSGRACLQPCRQSGTLSWHHQDLQGWYLRNRTSGVLACVW